ncbi:metal-binding protein [Clostridium hydrogenum]|uniref:metal-binding protein n=1 Tax=Clostridium hydrogenum TaxID=2855764 RepID=UPI001F38C004|nr:metal-binding protein [Clostridium hydrogenum]
MNANDIMKYIESEYTIINTIHCDVCGGNYEATEQGIGFIDNEPFDICECACSECGHKKIFEFPAPFLVEGAKGLKSKTLN